MTATHGFIPASRADIEAELRVRAHKDKDFRQQLLADPQTTLQQHYPQWFPDGKIPEEITIKVIEEDKQTLSIVLPQQQEDQFTEVDEKNLGQIVAAAAIRWVGEVPHGVKVNKANNTNLNGNCGYTSGSGCSTGQYCN